MDGIRASNLRGPEVSACLDLFARVLEEHFIYNYNSKDSGDDNRLQAVCYCGFGCRWAHTKRNAAQSWVEHFTRILILGDDPDLNVQNQL